MIPYLYIGTGRYSGMMDDRQLLALLRSALATDGDPTVAEVPPTVLPPNVRDAALAAWSWRTVDEELAELAYDSGAEPELAGVRGDTRHRQLTFEWDGSTLEVELYGRELLGQVLPGRRVRVRLSTPDGQGPELDSDDRGRFRAEEVPSGVFRLSYDAHDGPRRSTGWILP
jgi:hypothetical protein